MKGRACGDIIAAAWRATKRVRAVKSLIAAVADEGSTTPCATLLAAFTPMIRGDH
jgi:hypothetical protein